MRISPVLCGAALLFSMWGCALLPQEDDPLAPPIIVPPQTEYKLGAAKMGSIIREMRGNAALIAAREENISFPVSGGIVTKIHVKAGDAVSQGDLLIELECGSLAERLKVKELEIEKLRLQLSQAGTDRGRENTLSSLRGDVDRAALSKTAADKDVEAAAADYQSALELYQMGELSQTELTRVNDDVERARIAQQQAALALSQAQGALSREQATQSGGIDAQLLRIDIEMAQVELEALQKEWELTHLTATIDGIITFVEAIKPGESVQAFKPLVVVADPSELQLLYKGEKTREILPGMQADIFTKEGTYKGTVVMSPQNVPADALAMYRDAILIEPEELPGDARWGDRVDFNIVIAQKDNTLIIPADGLKRFMGRQYVAVWEDEIKREIDVVAGIEGLNEVEIVSGLQEGMQVILS